MALTSSRHTFPHPEETDFWSNPSSPRSPREIAPPRDHAARNLDGPGIGDGCLSTRVRSRGSHVSRRDQCRVKKHIGWHTFLHSVASLLGQNGEDVKVV